MPVIIIAQVLFFYAALILVPMGAPRAAGFFTAATDLATCVLFALVALITDGDERSVTVAAVVGVVVILAAPVVFGLVL